MSRRARVKVSKRSTLYLYTAVRNDKENKRSLIYLHKITLVAGVRVGQSNKEEKCGKVVLGSVLTAGYVEW